MPRQRHQVTIGVHQGSLRDANLELVTRHVFAQASEETPVSRARLAAETGITRSTSSRLVDALIEGRIIRSLPPVSLSGRGRPAVPLVPAPRSYVGLGMEVGVGLLAARLVDLTGSVVAEACDLVDLTDSDAVEALRRLGCLAGGLLDDLRATEEDLVLTGATLALPGLVHPDSGRLLVAPNLGWHDVDSHEVLRDVLGPDVGFSVANSANLAARTVAQDRPGHPGPWDSFLYLHGDIGVGAGILIGGREIRGENGWAGEIGHMTVDPHGEPCRCGSSGCLEGYIGRHRLMRRAGLDVHDPIERLVERSAWDPAVARTIEEAGRALGSVLSGVVNLLDIPTIVLGGDLSVLGESLMGPIGEELSYRLLSDSLAGPEVVIAPPVVAPAATGAAYHALDRVIRDPARWLAAEHLAGAGEALDAHPAELPDEPPPAAPATPTRG